ncbi:MAG: hypothetical protein AAFV33_23000 [Chloroflexota bacterium]
MTRWHNDPQPIDRDMDADDGGALPFIIFSLVMCLLMLATVLVLGMAI